MIQATCLERLDKFSVGRRITAREVFNIWAVPQQVMRYGGQDERLDLVELDPELPFPFPQVGREVEIGVRVRHAADLEGVEVW